MGEIKVELENMKIALIGGKGFIGSHLNERLLASGYEVKVIDKGDELNFEGTEIIYHLAGAINLKKGGDDNGIERAKNVCNLAKKHKVEKLIFFSSGGAIYNDPESEYAKANLEIENIIKNSGLSYAILRLSNVYGSGSRKQEFISQLVSNKKIIINADGNQKRDFIYIDDVIDVAIMAMEKEGTYNIGSGKTYSLNEIVEASGLKREVKYIDGESVDAKALDIEKTIKDFNWKPRVELKEGLKRIISK